MSVDEGDVLPRRRPLRALWRAVTFLPRHAIRAAWWCVPKPWRWRRKVKPIRDSAIRFSTTDDGSGFYELPTPKRPPDFCPNCGRPALLVSEKRNRSDSDLGAIGDMDIDQEFRADCGFKAWNVSRKYQGGKTEQLSSGWETPARCPSQGEMIFQALARKRLDELQPGDRVRVDCEGCMHECCILLNRDTATVKAKSELYPGHWIVQANEHESPCPAAQLTKVEEAEDLYNEGENGTIREGEKWR